VGDSFVPYSFSSFIVLKIKLSSIHSAFVARLSGKNRYYKFCLNEAQEAVQ
jgi:hypothetical protein